MPKKDSCEIIAVVDRSGSMAAVVDDSIGGFNTFLKAQQDLPGTCKMTRVIFDDRYDVIDNGVDIKSVKPFDHNSFMPRGMTALYDAIGKAVQTSVERIKKIPRDDKPEKVLVVILTDGAENASKEYTKSKIHDLIKTQTDKYKWEFIYLSADVNGFDEGIQLGFAAANTMQYSNDSTGTGAAYMNFTTCASSLRTKGTFELDRSLEGVQK